MTPRDTMADVADRADEATDHHAVSTMARIGYAARGVLFVTIGILAASVALAGDEEADATGAIDQLSDHAFGTAILVVLAVGLASYAILRFVHMVCEPDEDQWLKRTVHRIRYLVQGVVYGGLTVYTVGKLLGITVGGGGNGEEEATAEALQLPFGGWLVGAAALVVLGVGIAQVVKAVRGDVEADTELQKSWQRKALVWSGVIGHIARGVLFGFIAWLLLQAALQSDSSEAGGTDEAVRELAQTGPGTVLLMVVAVGVICYGLWGLAVARWGHPAEP